MTDELPYEAARDELVAIVAKLEAGGLGLEESLALWERGEKVAAICQQWLDGARKRLEGAGQTVPNQTGPSQDAESDAT